MSGPAHRLDERLAGGERAHPHRLLDGDLGEVDLPHDRMRPVPVHDGRGLETAQHLERHVAGGTVLTRTKRPLPMRGGARRVEHHHVEALHAALVGVGLPDLELHLGIGLEHLLEEEVAGAHQEHGDLARRRDHGVGDVVGWRGRPRRSGARRTTPPPGWLKGSTTARRTLGSRVERLLGEGLVVQRERERERCTASGEKFTIDMKACESKRPEVVPPDGEVGDGHVVGAAGPRRPSARGRRRPAPGRRPGGRRR